MSGEDSNTYRLLWVIPEFPFLGRAGSPHTSSVLLEALTKLGVQVDLLSFETAVPEAELKEAQQRLGLGNILLVPKQKLPKFFLFKELAASLRALTVPRLPREMFPYVNRNTIEVFDALFEGKTKRLKELGVRGEMAALIPSWDGVIYDGLHGSAHLFDGKRMTLPEDYPPVFYRAHCVVGDLWREKAKIERSAWLQAELVQEFELALLRKSTGAVPVSKEDGQRFLERLPRLQHEVVPVGFEFSANVPERAPLAGQYLFTSDLDWAPSRLGLLWLLEEVWPEVVERKPENKLVIVGGGERKYLSPYKNLPGIELTESKEDCGSEYRSAEALIVPLLSSGGVRTEIVEASRFGCPAISTSFGAQGLGLLSDVSYLEASGVPDWISRMTEGVGPHSQAIGSKAFEELASFCDPESCRSFLRVCEKKPTLIFVSSQDS